MSRQLSCLLLLPVLSLGMVSCKTVTPQRTDFLSSYSKMGKSKGLENAQVYEEGVSELDKYDKLYIEDVRYLGKTNGSKKHDVTAAEAKQLTGEFRTILQNELGKSMKLVNRRGRSTLSLRVAVTDAKASKPGLFLATYAPYVSGASTVLGLAQGKTIGAGSTRMQAEIIDSVSRKRYFAIVDENQGNKLQPSGLNRWGHTRTSFKKWGRKLAKIVRDKKQ